MNADIRIKLETAARVRDFCRAHPSDSPRHSAALARLEDRLARAETLAAQQRAGHLTVRASVVRRAELRKQIRDRHLRHLARIAVAAAPDQPVVAERFRIPASNANHKTFLTAARGIAAEAAQHRDVFVAYGMPEGFLEDLNTTLNQYEQGMSEAHSGLGAHVGARADLESVTAEIMELVQQFDAMNRYRFLDDPELHAAWESARNIPWHTSGGTGPTPPQGGVAPAA
ncbi:MAG TPA: hypothetical protein VH879_10290 [Gemmatimonadales bacterium]|jgi:hypothetical protein